MSSIVDQLTNILGQDSFNRLMAEIENVRSTGYDAPNLYKAVNRSYRVNGRKVPAFCRAPALQDSRESSLHYYGTKALANLFHGDEIGEEVFYTCTQIVNSYEPGKPQNDNPEAPALLQGDYVPRVLFSAQ